MLVMEEMFDALVGALIAAGAIPQNAASVMLEHLAERFIELSEGRVESDWQIDPAELRDQASRLRAQSSLGETAAALRAQLASPGISRRP